MFLAALLGWPAPMLPTQILWINLVTDCLPALALGMESPEPDVMKRKPRPSSEPLIAWQRGGLMLIHGSLITLVASLAFLTTHSGAEESLALARTNAFCVVAGSRLLFAIACRSHHYTMPQLGLFSNPALMGAILLAGLLQLGAVTLPGAQPFFRTVHPSLQDWTMILGLPLVPVTLVEVTKLLVDGMTRISGTTAGRGTPRGSHGPREESPPAQG